MPSCLQRTALLFVFCLPPKILFAAPVPFLNAFVGLSDLLGNAASGPSLPLPGAAGPSLPLPGAAGADSLLGGLNSFGGSIQNIYELTHQTFALAEHGVKVANGLSASPLFGPSLQSAANYQKELQEQLLRNALPAPLPRDSYPHPLPTLEPLFSGPSPRSDNELPSTDPFEDWLTEDVQRVPEISLDSLPAVRRPRPLGSTIIASDNPLVADLGYQSKNPLVPFTSSARFGNKNRVNRRIGAQQPSTRISPNRPTANINQFPSPGLARLPTLAAGKPSISPNHPTANINQLPGIAGLPTLAAGPAHLIVPPIHPPTHFSLSPPSFSLPPPVTVGTQSPRQLERASSRNSKNVRQRTPILPPIASLPGLAPLPHLSSHQLPLLHRLPGARVGHLHQLATVGPHQLLSSPLLHHLPGVQHFHQLPTGVHHLHPSPSPLHLAPHAFHQHLLNPHPQALALGRTLGRRKRRQ